MYGGLVKNLKESGNSIHLFPGDSKRLNATNGEWMRSLTDEEFAWFIFRDKAGLYMKSPKEIIEWLKEEIKLEC